MLKLRMRKRIYQVIQATYVKSHSISKSCTIEMKWHITTSPHNCQASETRQHTRTKINKQQELKKERKRRKTRKTHVLGLSNPSSTKNFIILGVMGWCIHKYSWSENNMANKIASNSKN